VRARLQEPIRQAAQAASNKTTTPAELMGVASRAVAQAFAGASKAETDALALITLMEAEKDARTELIEIQTRQEAVKQAKDCRSELSCLERLGGKGGTSKEIAQKAIDDIKNQRDSLRELGDIDSQRTKKAMERSEKLLSALSNVLKKIAATSETITQNLK
jgi:predicted transcriptional regulator